MKCSSNFRGTFRMDVFSCLIHNIAVVTVLLVCIIDFSSGVQEDLVKVPMTKDASKLGTSINGSTSQTTRELQETLKASPDGLLSPATKTFFGEDVNGVPIVVGTWFRYGSYTLAFAMFGTAFLVSCAMSAVYYVLFVVTEPSQQRSASRDEGWNVGRILRALQIAYDTYETFDPYNASCQLKTVCEIQESGHFEGTMIKRLTHFMIHTDLVRKKMANADDLQAADRIGNDPNEECNARFPECKFSLNKLYDTYLTF
ncbi:hypothetical protein Ocin01_04804 [Orchesella cincta]|uniref:Uncharacterized protein n=1 Tax=Orchesella cincta TaxID=48709 RepID=A0A1D2N9H0_ORCCI|nr:hypothetical protein Ocin01_04804 [Orchesella cincta]